MRSLRKLCQTLTTAESCTGGLIASMLTRIPGSSAGFHAGLVTYSNEMKTSLLGVDANLLSEHGAVSEPVVIAMAEGALARTNASRYGLAGLGQPGIDPHALPVLASRAHTLPDHDCSGGSGHDPQNSPGNR